MHNKSIYLTRINPQTTQVGLTHIKWKREMTRGRERNGEEMGNFGMVATSCPNAVIEKDLERVGANSS